MKKDKPKAEKEMEVSVTFEPSRVAGSCLREAYERVMPVVRGRSGGKEVTEEDSEAVKTPRQGGIKR